MYTFPSISNSCMAAALLLGLCACERDDSEPDLKKQDFSRLYVSFEEYGTSDVGIPDRNLRIVYPADSSEFTISVNHVSEAKGGGPVHFDPFLRTLYQAGSNLDGRNDTAVHAMAIGDTGLPTNRGGMRNRLYNKVTGLATSFGSEYFFIVNIGGDGGSGDPAESALYIVEKPRQKNGYARPMKKLKAPGLSFYGIAYASNGVFITKTGENGGIYHFENVVNTPVNPADSIGTLSPTRTLTIPGTSNIRGISYDTLKNVLALTDYPSGATVGQGRVLIFENFSSLLPQSSITPTRIVTGMQTGLHQPVDVAVDRRASGQYLYVADRGAKKVLRFKLSDDGDVVPDKSLTTDLTPVGLSLDSRDQSTVGNIK